MNIFKFLGGDKVEPHQTIIENNNFFRKEKKKLPIDEYEFTVFDTELSSLDKKKGEIVAIGAVKIRNLQIQCADTFYALVKPDDLVHTDSTLIHRITPEELTKAQSLIDILPKFIEFCGHSCLVGHYVGLDVGFVNRAAQKILGGFVHNPCLDTMRLAMAFNESKHGRYYDHYNSMSSYNLGSLSKEYNLPKFAEHNALEDSIQTAYLFLFLIKQLRRKGERTLKDFLKAGRNWKILY